MGKLYGSVLPAYVFPAPTTDWDAWIAGAPRTKFMIADPGDPGGPGVAADPFYVAAIAHAKANGISIAGYVDTNYNAVATATVTGQIDLWHSLYGVHDIFFDRTSALAADLPYYQNICNYSHRTASCRVILNPGTPPDEGYLMGMAEIVNVFEGIQASYDAYTQPSYVLKYPPTLLSHLIYNASSAAVAEADMAKAASLGAGYVYVTDNTGGAPWAAVPTYFTAEIAYFETLEAPGGGGSGA